MSTPRSDETSDASYSEASYSECDSCKNADTGTDHRMFFIMKRLLNRFNYNASNCMNITI